MLCFTLIVSSLVSVLQITTRVRAHAAGSHVSLHHSFIAVFGGEGNLGTVFFQKYVATLWLSYLPPTVLNINEYK